MVVVSDLLAFICSGLRRPDYVQGISDLAGETVSEVQEGHEECQALRGLADDLARQMGGFRLWIGVSFIAGKAGSYKGSG